MAAGYKQDVASKGSCDARCSPRVPGVGTPARWSSCSGTRPPFSPVSAWSFSGAGAKGKSTLGKGAV